MVTAHLTLQGVFHNWHEWQLQEKNDRETDGFTQRQARESAIFQRQLKEFESQARSLRQQWRQTRAETEAQAAPLRAAREEASLRAEQLEVVIASMGEVAARVT